VKIIVNADDFGYSRDVVRATIDCFERQLVTSATIMPNGAATGEAISYARSSGRSFGVHLTLTGDGVERPLSNPSLIPSLVDARGCLLDTSTARLRAVLRRLRVPELETEIVAQIEYLLDCGVPISHVDSHRHLHKFGPIREALVRALPRFGISRVRNVQDLYVRRAFLSPTYWLGRRWRQAIVRTFVSTDHFYMPTSAGDHDWGEAVCARLASAHSHETLEVGVHPGYTDPWRDSERRALETFVAYVRRDGHALVDWDEISLNRPPG
jgi:predicted glycoside hydrolase/deacetylase ChbG (UPF0249 family)